MRTFNPRNSQTQWYASYWRHYQWLRRVKKLSREDWARGRGLTDPSRTPDPEKDLPTEFFADRRPMMLACCAARPRRPRRRRSRANVRVFRGPRPTASRRSA